VSLAILEIYIVARIIHIIIVCAIMVIRSPFQGG
jgi:hypothetical protein